MVRRRWQWLLRAVPSPRETPRNEVWVGHSEELLWQRVVGQEVKLRGVRRESGVGGGRIVEPGAQRQVLPEQLHVVLYPLQRRSSLLSRIRSKLSRLGQVRRVV